MSNQCKRRGAGKAVLVPSNRGRLQQAVVLEEHVETSWAQKALLHGEGSWGSGGGGGGHMGLNKEHRVDQGTWG